MWRRLLLLLELDGADAALAFARRLAPEPERVAAVLLVPGLEGLFGRPDLEELVEAEQAAQALFARLRERFGAAAADVELLARIEPERLREQLAQERAEALLVGPLAGTGDERALELVEAACNAAGLPAIWAPREAAEAAPAAETGPLRELLLPAAPPYRELAPVAGLLRDRCTPAQRLTVLGLGPDGSLSEGGVAAMLQLAGIRARGGLVARREGEEVEAAIARAAAQSGAGLIALAPVSRRELRVLLAATPQALLVTPAPPEEPAAAGRLASSDALAAGAAPRARLELEPRLGAPGALPDQEVALVAGGREVGRVRSRGGVIRLAPEVVAAAGDAGRIGVARPAPGADALSAVEASIALLRPGHAPLTLVDVRLADDALALLIGALSADEGRLFVLVRLRPEEPFDAIRERLATLGLGDARVLDAGALLDEGASEDVPPAVDPVRLCRLAARLRALGLSVDSAAHLGHHPRAADGFAAFAEAELQGSEEVAQLDEVAVRGRIAAARAPLPQGTALDVRLDACTGSRLQPGNRVEVELRNDVARRALLDAIGAARERVHLQAYIARDDAVSDQVEAALASAAARGVAVRVLVDSLYSLHGSYGAENPLLARLAQRPGIEVRTIRPLAGLPSVRDLKQRDHRKLVLVDGRRCSVGGRNLAREYLLAFAEVQLRPDSQWSEVPWLDAGCWVEGPVVAALERSFAEAWAGAGGAPYPITEPPPAGPTAARVVIHRGLEDARTLEAYLALIDSARRTLEVVNTFPLQLELQHALLGAVARGVRVRALFGNPRPLHGETAFAGSGALREVANQLTRSRIDALVEAGGEAYECALRDVPGWDPALGMVRPHVHAKLVCADAEVCAIGSANLDITASYWESEALLVVQDPRVAGALAAELEPLFAGGVRVDRADPGWSEQASRRAWLSRWWPSLLG